MAIGALLARSATAGKGDGDPVTNPPLADGGIDGLNDPGKLMPGNVGQGLDIGIMSLPGMPVTAAYPCCLYPDDGTPGGEFGIGQINNFKRGGEITKLGGFHSR